VHVFIAGALPTTKREEAAIRGCACVSTGFGEPAYVLIDGNPVTAGGFIVTTPAHELSHILGAKHVPSSSVPGKEEIDLVEDSFLNDEPFPTPGFSNRAIEENAICDTMRRRAAGPGFGVKSL
jgi:hypothetical protein